MSAGALKRSFDRLYEADRSLKSSRVDPDIQVTRLVARLCEEGAARRHPGPRYFMRAFRAWARREMVRDVALNDSRPRPARSSRRTAGSSAALALEGSLVESA